MSVSFHPTHDRYQISLRENSEEFQKINRLPSDAKVQIAVERLLNGGYVFFSTWYHMPQSSYRPGMNESTAEANYPFHVDLLPAVTQVLEKNGAIHLEFRQLIAPASSPFAGWCHGYDINMWSGSNNL